MKAALRDAKKAEAIRDRPKDARVRVKPEPVKCGGICGRSTTRPGVTSWICSDCIAEAMRRRREVVAQRAAFAARQR